jgi:hypothetical protein
MDLKQRLNRLGKDVNRLYPDINHGGCCVYAAMVVAELRKQKIPAVGIVAAWDAKEECRSIDEARNNLQKNTLRDWNDNGIYFNHVGVEFELNGVKKHYDSNGVHKVRNKLDNMPIYPGRLRYKELKELASCKEGWNPSFDRKCIRTLQRMVKSYISGDGALAKKSLRLQYGTQQRNLKTTTALDRIRSAPPRL